MAEKSKSGDRNKARVVLGPLAKQIVEPFTAEVGETTQTQLENAIADLLESRDVLDKSLKAAHSGEDSSLKKTIRDESDQLFHELKETLDAHHQETLNMFNGLRLMLNVYGGEQSGEDVDNLIRETNAWLDKTIKPISQSREEVGKKRANDGRPQDENEHQATALASHEMNQPGRETVPELDLGIGPDRDFDGGRG